MPLVRRERTVQTVFARNGEIRVIVVADGGGGGGGGVGRPVSGRGSTRWILIWDVGRQGTGRRAEPPPTHVRPRKI